MNSRSKAKLHAVAEKWAGGPVVVVFLPPSIPPEDARAGEGVMDLINTGHRVAVYHPETGLRACNVYAGRVFALVPIHHPRAELHAPWWKPTNLKLRIA